MRVSLHYILRRVWDICFPPSPEEELVASLTTEDLSEIFSLGFTNGVWHLSSFQHPSTRALIHEAKFHRNEHAYHLLAELLALFLTEKKSLSTAVWIPIPLSKKRFRERGYNQVEEVLRALPKPHTLDMCLPCLVRNRNTQPQTELARTERLQNMHGVFAVANTDDIQGKDIVILDDVTTTGATLSAAKAALLLHAPQSITLVALAH